MVEWGWGPYIKVQKSICARLLNFQMRHKWEEGCQLLLQTNPQTNNQKGSPYIHVHVPYPLKKIDIFNFMEGQILPPSSQNLVSIGIKDYVCLTTLDKCQKTDWLVGHLCLGQFHGKGCKMKNGKSMLYLIGRLCWNLLVFVNK